VNYFPLFYVQYIIVLFLLFVVQFIVACACLAIGQSQQRSLFQSGWHEAEGLRRKMQRKFDCCGAFSDDQMDVNGTHPPCNLTSVSRPFVLTAFSCYSRSHVLADLAIPHCTVTIFIGFSCLLI